jgi:hypothetical protein
MGQILDRIFQLLRGHLRLFVEIGSVPAAALCALYALLATVLFAAGAFVQPPHALDEHKVIWMVFPSMLVGIALFLLIYAVFEAAATHAALQVNQGAAVTSGAAYRVAWRNAGRFLWLMILRSLVIMLPTAACFAIIGGVSAVFISHGAASDSHAGALFLLVPLIILLYLGSMVYAVLMGLRLALAPSACVVEGRTAYAALQRSFELTRKAMGRIFLVLVVVYAAGYLAFLLFEAVCALVVGIGAVATMAMHIQFAPPWSYAGIALAVLLGVAMMFFWIAAIAASYVIAFAVLYHDQRLRMEGVAPGGPTGY